MIEGSCLCGAVRWQFEGQPDGATACNCTACRRYGVLWAYDYEGEGIKVSGRTQAYVRGKALEFHFCPVCGCVVFWRGQQRDQQGRLRIAVNLRLAEPEAVAQIPIDHFDGLNTFDDLPIYFCVAHHRDQYRSGVLRDLAPYSSGWTQREQKGLYELPKPTSC